jgi:predicted transcriptional regulator
MTVTPQAGARNTPDYCLDRLTELAPALTGGQRDRLAALGLAALGRDRFAEWIILAGNRRRQRRQQVTELRRQGMTQRAIAKTIGCSVNTVSDDLHAAVDNGDLPAAALARVKTPEQVQQAEAAAARRRRAAELRRQGMTLQAIADVLGVTTTAVWYYLLAAEAGAGDHDAA